MPANPVILSAAGRLRAAYLHGSPEDVIVRRRQEMTAARAVDLLEKSGALPLSDDLIADVIAAARGAN